MIKKLLLTGFIVLFAFSASPAITSAQSDDVDTESLLEQVAELLETVRSLQDQLADIEGRRNEVRAELRETVQLTRDLARGMSGEDVEDLQELLASDPEIYPEGLVTGFYGPLTARAVERLQERFGIESVGRVGPQTRSTLNRLFSRLHRGDGSPNSGPGNFFDRFLVDADDIDDIDEDDDIEFDDLFPGRSGHRVLVCHLGSIGQKHTLAVAPPAVQAHLAHGDELGRCDLDLDDDDDDEGDDDDRDDQELEIEVEFEDGEAFVKVEFEDGEEENFVFDTTDEDEIIEVLAEETDLTEEEIREVIEFEEMCEIDEDHENVENDAESILLDIEFLENLVSDGEWQDASDLAGDMEDDVNDLVQSLEDIGMDDEAENLSDWFGDLLSEIGDEDEDGADDLIDDIEDFLEDTLDDLDTEDNCDDDDDDDDDDDE